jgi:hypothetical protein
MHGFPAPLKQRIHMTHEQGKILIYKGVNMVQELKAGLVLLYYLLLLLILNN